MIHVIVWNNNTYTKYEIVILKQSMMNIVVNHKMKREVLLYPKISIFNLLFPLTQNISQN